MKKFLAMLLTVLMAIVLVACGNNEKQYYGTWDSVSAKVDGSIFTIDELEAMGDYSLSDFRIVIKEGGKAYVYSEESGVTLDWKTTDDGIKIGVKECVFKDDLLSIENNGITIYLSKISDNQTIKPPSSDNKTDMDNENDKNDDSSSDTDDSSNTNNDTSGTTNSDLTFAKNLAEQSHLSKFETETKLFEEGYSLTEAEELANNCGANWNKQAAYRAEDFAEYYATVSPSMIIDLLLDCEFTNSQAEYAIENCDIDWRYYAVIHAESYLYMGEVEVVTPLDTKIHLEWDKGYSVEDSEYAVNNCDINWNNQALLYIEHIDTEEGPYGPKSDYITALTDYDFTESQALYAIENYDINWYLHALSCLAHFVEDLSGDLIPDKYECIEALEDWGFSKMEIEYALQEYGYGSSITLWTEVDLPITVCDSKNNEVIIYEIWYETTFKSNDLIEIELTFYADSKVNKGNFSLIYSLIADSTYEETDYTKFIATYSSDENYNFIFSITQTISTDNYTITFDNMIDNSDDAEFELAVSEAIEYIQSWSDYYSSKCLYVENLQDYGFTQEQIDCAMENCGLDWNWYAFDSLENFLILSNTPPTRAECMSALESYGFNSSEIAYALSQFDDSNYAD